MGKKDASKKAQKIAKAKKQKSKGEAKTRKKIAKDNEDLDDLDIDTILEEYNKKQKEFLAIEIINSDRPSKRLNSCMVANPIKGKHELFLFGGETIIGNLAKFYNDLYVYSLGNKKWKKIISPNTPLPRSGHSMCVHPSGIILLFGGEFSSPKQSTFYHYGDTWILDGKTFEWTNVETKKSPSPRSGHRLTYWKNYILLHGGFKDQGISTLYHSDLWAFDITDYTWNNIELPNNVPVPDPRSGHSFLPTPDGGIIWGGYSKIKSSKGQYNGKVHTDIWGLKMNSDLSLVRWERKKKSSFAPTPRVGCSMVFHKGRGILFGGVYDTQETEESLKSTFFNDLYAYQIDSNRWHRLAIRKLKQKIQLHNDKSIKVQKLSELADNLNDILKRKGLQDNDGDDNDGDDNDGDDNDDDDSYDNNNEKSLEGNEQNKNDDKNNEDDKDQDNSVSEYSMRFSLPHPRFNTTCAVVDDTLFLFGGVWENDEVEYIFDSMYSIDLGRLDGVQILWEDTSATNLEAFIETKSSSDSDSDEDSDEENEKKDELNNNNIKFHENLEKNKKIIEENKSNEIIANEIIANEIIELNENTQGLSINPDARPWLPHPKPFENIRDFYLRTMSEFLEWAISENKEARGKELKRLAFELSESRWWERREEVRAAEDQYEELGGIVEIVEREEKMTRNRR